MGLRVSIILLTMLCNVSCSEGRGFFVYQTPGEAWFRFFSLQQRIHYALIQ
jgi:hypothetical protein